jgi:hypothetical protein
MTFGPGGPSSDIAGNGPSGRWSPQEAYSVSSFRTRHAGGRAALDA